MLIDSGVSGHLIKLDKVLEIITQTLYDFGDVETKTIRLEEISLPYHNGEKSKIVENIAEEMKNSNGVIFAATAGNFAPNSLMLCFTEHLMGINSANRGLSADGILKDKNCLISVTSDYGGERNAAEILSRMIAALKGFDAGRILVGPEYLRSLVEGHEDYDEIKSVIERQTEDYYRIIRQNRKFLIPFDASESSIQREYSAEFSNQIKNLKRYDAEQLSEKYNLNALEPNQVDKINELSQLFAEKYSAKPDSTIVLTGGEGLDIDYSSIKPRLKTCRQITHTLPHYYKPQYAEGVNIIIQLLIKGVRPEEDFAMILTLNNGECICTDGQSDNADLTIMADEKAWLEIMTGKNTAQKSFMVGKIKVRGNFVYLSKLDYVFSFSTSLG